MVQSAQGLLSVAIFLEVKIQTLKTVWKFSVIEQLSTRSIFVSIMWRIDVLLNFFSKPFHPFLLTSIILILIRSRSEGLKSLGRSFSNTPEIPNVSGHETERVMLPLWLVNLICMIKFKKYSRLSHQQNVWRWHNDY